METEHTVKSFDEELDRIDDLILEMGGLVETQLSQAAAALARRDTDLAARIITGDQRVDELERAIDTQAIRVIALRQPVAEDLRRVVSSFKIASNLERIGDLAVHIVERVPEVSSEFIRQFDFQKMGAIAKEMVQKSIQAFVNRDRELAEEVCDMDEELDAMHRAVFKKVSTEIRQADVNQTTQYIVSMSVSRYIERIGDHATRIAREVIYLVTGEIVRHSEGSFEKLIESLKD